jgi:hypothetical protein
MRLKRKYRKKLWPFRAATRAGQNAMAIQTTMKRIDQSQTPFAARSIIVVSSYR